VSPTNGVTEDRVLYLLNNGFKEYDREIGLPRHKDNLNTLNKFGGDLKELNDSWQQIRGAMTFAKIVGTFIATACGLILTLLTIHFVHTGI